MGDDPRALHLVGRVRLKAGRADEAVAALQKAHELDSSNLQVMLALGSAERARGRLDRAEEVFLQAARLAPGLNTPWFNLGLVRRDQGRLLDATLAFRKAADLDPSDFIAVQNVVTTVALAVQRGERPFPVPPRESPARDRNAVSIVTCSIDPARLARFEARMRPHLAGREHELIVIRDAKSLAQGYRRGWEESRHPVVVFCHDDFSIVSNDPFSEIDRVLEGADIVGFAGSTRASGPAVIWSGHPHMHGWVTHPDPKRRGLVTAVMSLKSGVIDGMQTLDGVFMAMRRDIPGRVGFDETTFDGFHFYDLDFSYRASRAGLRLAVTTNIVAIHESLGNFGAEYQRYADRFCAKFPELSEPRGPYHWYEAIFQQPEEVVRFCEQLRGLAQTP